MGIQVTALILCLFRARINVIIAVPGNENKTEKPGSVFQCSRFLPMVLFCGTIFQKHFILKIVTATTGWVALQGDPMCQ